MKNYRYSRERIVKRRIYVAKVIFLYAVMIAISLFFLTSCAVGGAGITGGPVRSVCVIDAESGMCWQKKAEKKGRPLSQMSGEFGVSAIDFERILQKLNLCENPPVVSDSSLAPQAPPFFPGSGSSQQPAPGSPDSPFPSSATGD